MEAGKHLENRFKGAFFHAPFTNIFSRTVTLFISSYFTCLGPQLDTEAASRSCHHLAVVRIFFKSGFLL